MNRRQIYWITRRRGRRVAARGARTAVGGRSSAAKRRYSRQWWDAPLRYPPRSMALRMSTFSVYVRHQSMFVVTPEGVIAIDPIGLRRPAAKAYIEEIQKITNAALLVLSIFRSGADSSWDQRSPNGRPRAAPEPTFTIFVNSQHCWSKGYP